MTVLRRFRFGRQGIDEEDEDEGDLTISTETVSRISAKMTSMLIGIGYIHYSRSWRRAQ
jgi:hypothetical protein